MERRILNSKTVSRACLCVVFRPFAKNTKKINLLFFSDPRVKEWPMMSSPLPTLAICMFYAYFSKVLGPKLMENRKPFNLRNVLIIYNLVQTVFSAWIFYEVGTYFS